MHLSRSEWFLIWFESSTLGLRRRAAVCSPRRQKQNLWTVYPSRHTDSKVKETWLPCSGTRKRLTFRINNSSMPPWMKTSGSSPALLPGVDLIDLDVSHKTAAHLETFVLRAWFLAMWRLRLMCIYYSLARAIHGFASSLYFDVADFLLRYCASILLEEFTQHIFPDVLSCCCSNAWSMCLFSRGVSICWSVKWDKSLFCLNTCWSW